MLPKKELLIGTMPIISFAKKLKVNNKNWQKTSSLYFDRKLTDYQTSSDYIEQLFFFKVNFATVF